MYLCPCKSCSTPPDITTLHSRLVATRTIPSTWIDLSQLQSLAAVVLCTMRYNECTLSGEISFTLQINSSFQWSLTVSGHLVQPDRCSLLADAPTTLQSVTNVDHLLAILDSSKICEGNADPKFQPLINRHKGILRDPSGTTYTCLTLHAYL